MSTSPSRFPLPRTLSSFIQSYNATANSEPTTPSTTSSQTLTQPSKPTPPSPPTNKMAFGRRNNNAVVTKTTKPTLMTRLRGRNAKTRTVKTTTTIEPAHHNTHGTRSHHTTGNTRTTRSSGWGNRRTAQPATVHHRRHASIGDKISGAMMKLKGSLTHRPGLKAAGTRRQNGTDGRGSHRVY